MATSPPAPPVAPSLHAPGILAALMLWAVGAAVLLGVTYRDWRGRRAARRGTADREQLEFPHPPAEPGQVLEVRRGAGRLDAPTSTREAQRIADTMSFLPQHLGFVLEVGCGDGRLGRALQARATRYIGLDIPWPYSQRPEGLVYGSIANLPFADCSVDTVVCCEVIEHLDDATFQAGLRELRRVARRTLLVTVPHAQYLAADAVRCPSCGHVFHRYSHVRRFEVCDVARLWPNLQPDVATTLGAPVRGYAPPLAYRLQHALGAYPAPVWECEACGRRAASRQPSLATRASRAVISRLERRAPRRAPWVIARWTVG